MRAMRRDFLPSSNRLRGRNSVMLISIAVVMVVIVSLTQVLPQILLLVIHPSSNRARISPFTMAEVKVTHPNKFTLDADDARSKQPVKGFEDSGFEERNPFAIKSKANNEKVDTALLKELHENAVEEEEDEEVEKDNAIASKVVDVDNVKSIFDLDLNSHFLDTKSQFQPFFNPENPRLVFVKGYKVGGTTVTFALNNVADKYNIKIAKPMQARIADEVLYAGNKTYDCPNKGSLFCQHAVKKKWMSLCIDRPRFTTILRDPVAQELSYRNYHLNKVYFENFPTVQCEKKQYMEIGRQYISKPNHLRMKLNEVSLCEDTPFRRNVTFNLIASRIAEPNYGEHNLAVWNSMIAVTGIATHTAISEQKMIEVLKSDYFLVGVTERLNEFLVLLSLLFGWSLPDINYRKCKITNFDVKLDEFKRYFPDLVVKLENMTKVARVAYDYAKSSFDQILDRNLNAQTRAWFDEKVREYRTNLKAYFEEVMKDEKEPFRWKIILDAQGRKEMC